MQNSRSCLNVVSNRSEQLITALGETLFCGKPFAPKIVVVPSAVQKNQILFSFAQNKKWGICAAVQFYTVEQFLSAQLQREEKEKRLLSSLELSFLIEYALLRALNDPTLDTLFQPVHRYVDDKSEKQEQRTTALSHEISALFVKYSIYGLRFLDAWLEKKGWQQHLWERVFTGQWTYPIELCRKEVAFHYPVHLFGFSYIPPIYRSYFMQMGATFYLLSPSPLFLGDVYTDRERLYVEKAGIRKGVALAERQEFHTLLKEPNRLIANFGKLRRETLSLLEEETSLIDERYEEPTQKTFLQHIQRDLFHLSNPEEVQDITRDDRSLEVHAASSLHREVEILRDHILHRYQAGIPLKEMVVLSSNMSAYLPYIEALFGADEHPIPFTLKEAKGTDAGSFDRGFLHLLSLKKSRYELEEVLKLFSCTPFIERLGMDERDAELFCSWLRKTNLMWGLSGSHRQKVLSSDEPPPETGTWEWAFDRLLWGLGIREAGSDMPVSPLNLVSMTEAEVLGKGISAVLEIKKSFDHMDLNPGKSFSDWVDALQEIALQFFVETTETLALFSELEKARKKLKSLDEPLFSFESLLKGVHRFFRRKKGGISTSNLEAVNFHPLSDGNICQASCIFLLGLQEGAFPQAEKTSPFLDAEYIKQAKPPLAIDEQRNLFLETLLQAKDSLVISYQKVSDDDGKELQPSLFIQELFSYLDRGYRVGGEMPSEALIKEHPASAFDDPGASSETQYDAARALYSAPEKAMPSFFEDSLALDKSEQAISMQNLMRCARHPIRFFLNYSLGIYCRWPDPQDEEFVLSPLEKVRMRKESLKIPLEEVIKRAKHQGTLPLWQFGSVAQQTVMEEISEYHQSLKKFRVAPYDVFEIELVEHLKEAYFLSKNHLLMPAIDVTKSDGSRVKIVGKLFDLSSIGMLVYGKASPEEIAKVWPAYLVYLLLDNEKLAQKRLLFTKDGKEKSFSIENPMELFVKYLDYFDACSEQISLFMPSWADAVINGDADALEKKMSATEKEVKRKRGDPYLQWFFMREHDVDVKPFYIKMAPQLREVMHGVV